MNISDEILNRIKKVVRKSNNFDKVSIHEPSFKDSNAIKYITECIDSGWVSSSGKWVSNFENQIAEFTGVKYAIAVSNGTVALRLALYLVGVRSNDEVLIPPLSFVATANAVSHLGAKPHFIDIDSDTLAICPNALDKRIEEVANFKGSEIYNKFSGRKISAVVPVHIFGMPAKINEIKEVCDKWKIPLVEDAAEALGSKIICKNKFIHCGSVGEIGTLSFNGNKVITTGGGGALLTNKKNLADLAKHLSTTAKVNHNWDFYHDQIAWNDRMPNLNAALGSSQIEKIDIKLRKKRVLQSRFVEAFKDIEEVEIMKETKNSISNYWLITIRLNTKNPAKLRHEILHNSHISNIFLRPSWTLLNQLPMYKNSSCGNLSQAENQSQRLINLPSSPQLIKDF